MQVIGTPMVPNILVTGSSGGGKTKWIEAFMRLLKGKYKYLVVLNTTDQLSEFCRAKVEVDSDALEKRYTPTGLAALIRRYVTVHFEFSADEEDAGAKDFLSALGKAIKMLGVKYSNVLEVLVVIDECQRFLSKAVIQRAWKILETEGRKFGVGMIKATQQLASVDTDTIAPVVRRQTREVVIFPLSDDAERQRIMRMFPGLPDPGVLQFPDPVRGYAPEYIFYARISNKAVRMTRQANGSRVAVLIENKRKTFLETPNS
jgi:hypothetical protein